METLSSPFTSSGDQDSFLGLDAEEAFHLSGASKSSPQWLPAVGICLLSLVLGGRFTAADLDRVLTPEGLTRCSWDST